MEDALTLLQRIAKGERDAFASFYDQYSSLVYTLALRIMRKPVDAEDVAQEAFLQVWNQAGQYRRDRGTVEAWLITITRSRAIDKTRSRRRKDRGKESFETLTGEDVLKAERREGSLSLSETIGMRLSVEGALEGLAEPQRRVIELSYYDGMTHEEIAARLNEPLGTVKSRLRAGLKHLRDYYQKVQQ